MLIFFLIDTVTVDLAYLRMKINKSTLTIVGVMSMVLGTYPGDLGSVSPVTVEVTSKSSSKIFNTGSG